MGSSPEDFLEGRAAIGVIGRPGQGNRMQPQPNRGSGHFNSKARQSSNNPGPRPKPRMVPQRSGTSYGQGNAGPGKQGQFQSNRSPYQKNNKSNQSFGSINHFPQKPGFAQNMQKNPHLLPPKGYQGNQGGPRPQGPPRGPNRLGPGGPLRAPNGQRPPMNQGPPRKNGPHRPQGRPGNLRPNGQPRHPGHPGAQARPRNPMHPGPHGQLRGKANTMPNRANPRFAKSNSNPMAIQQGMGIRPMRPKMGTASRWNVTLDNLEARYNTQQAPRGQPRAQMQHYSKRN